MRRRDIGEETVKDLEARFTVIEKRVQALLAENKGLRARVNNLQEELARATRDVQQLEDYNGRKQHIREKIERILQQLDAVDIKK